MKTHITKNLLLIASVFLATTAIAQAEGSSRTHIPTITLSASPTSIAYNGSTTLSWSSSYANSCQASGAYSGSAGTSGSKTFSGLTSTSIYTITCSGNGGQVSKSVTVTVATAPTPTVSLSANPTSIASGGSTVLSWTSTNAKTCLASGAWSGTEASSGSTNFSGLTSSATYTLTCTSAGGLAASSSVTVSVTPPPAPTISLSANPVSVANGGKTTLTWSSTNATSCSASGAWTGAEATSGSYQTAALSTNSNFTLSCSGAGGTVSQTASVAVAPVSGTAGSAMGINLSEVNDWDDRQLTFVDVMKQSRGFASLSNPWDPTTNPVPLDANGWPTTDFGVYFITTTYDPLQRPLTATYPSMFGTYTLSFTGKATVSSTSGSQITNQIYNSTTNTTTAQVVVGPSVGYLDLEFSNTNGGVKNLQLLRPGYALGSTQVFTTQLLQALSPFGTIRAMELLQTNGNPVTTWAGRKQVSDPTQQDARGIAWEYVIQLANAANKDIWINIPQGVDLTDTSANNYVTQLATLLKANLNPSLHVYVEYSNELWNTQFSQTTNNMNAAIAEVNSGADTSLNYDNVNNQWYWGYRRVAHQTVRISQLFANVYGAAAINTTIRPVYVSQDVQPFLTEDSLAYIKTNFGNPSQYIYAIGGAPYFSAGTADTTLNGLFSALQTGLNQYLPGFSGLPAYNGGAVYTGISFKSLAAYYGLHSVTYEGGPDLTAETNSVLTEQAAGDLRINQLVQDQLADFFGCGNDLFVYYKLASPPGTGSVFGAYEDITVPTEKSTALTTVAATPLSMYSVCTSTVNSSLFVQ